MEVTLATLLQKYGVNMRADYGNKMFRIRLYHQKHPANAQPWNVGAEGTTWEEAEKSAVDSACAVLEL